MSTQEYTTEQLFKAFSDLEGHRRSYSSSAEQIALFDAVSGDTDHKNLATELVEKFSDDGVASFVSGVASSSTSTRNPAQELFKVANRYLELRNGMDASLEVLSSYGISGKMDAESMVDPQSPIYVMGEGEEVLTAPQAIVARVRQGGVELPEQFGRVISHPKDCELGYRDRSDIAEAVELLATIGVTSNDPGANRAFKRIPTMLYSGKKDCIFGNLAEYKAFVSDLTELTK